MLAALQRTRTYIGATPEWMARKCLILQRKTDTDTAVAERWHRSCLLACPTLNGAASCRSGPGYPGVGRL